VAFLGDEPDDHVPPLYDYGHGPGCSITGGLVYRGAALPALVGAYVFTDLCDGEIRVLSMTPAPSSRVALGSQRANGSSASVATRRVSCSSSRSVAVSCVSVGA
jgi:hypothetical protein